MVFSSASLQCEAGNGRRFGRNSGDSHKVSSVVISQVFSTSQLSGSKKLKASLTNNAGLPNNRTPCDMCTCTPAVVHHMVNTVSQLMSVYFALCSSTLIFF